MPLLRYIAGGTVAVYLLARFIPLVFVVLIAIVAVVSAIAGGIFTLAVLLHQKAIPPLKRRIEPLALVGAWSSIERARREEKSMPTQSIGQMNSMKIRFEQLLSLIQRDFIKSWYSGISDEDIFMRKADGNVRSILKELQLRAQRVDLVTLLMKKILPIFTDHIQKYRSAVAQVRRQYVGAQGDAEVTQSEELDKLVVLHYRKSKLHRALSKNGSPDSEMDYLRRVMELLLPVLCPQRDYDSSLYRLLLREIFASKVLHPVLAMVADPDYVNQLIDDMAGKELSDRKKAMRVRETLDQFFTGHVSGDKESEPSSQSFDEFLRSIRECNTVLDAKRIRHHIVAEIKKNQQKIKNKKPDDILTAGVRVRDLQRYINRLIVAKKRAERRIEELSGKRVMAFENEVDELSIEAKTDITFATVFRSNTALFYFMEFMERQSAMKPLQFLLTTESFRRLVTTATPDDEKMIQEDAKRIYTLYLAPDAPERMKISEKATNDVLSYVNREEHAKTDHDSILRAQKEVFDQVNEEYYSKFVQSDLFFRYTSDPAAQAELDAENELVADDKASADEKVPETSIKEEETLEPDSETVAAMESAFKTIVSGKEEISSTSVPQPTSVPLAYEREASVYNLLDHHSDDDLDMTPPSELMQAKALLNDINDSIDALRHQKDIIDTLIKKAAKKNNTEELRILNLSKQKLQEELREMLVKKAKYEDQEDKTVITPGLWTVHISNSTIGYENGKPFSLYIIEVHRADPQNPSGWIVARRYREFSELHEKLRRQYPIVRDFELPGKRMMNLFKLKPQFVEERRVQLEAYLQRLLDQAEICRSIELREFLYQREYAQVPSLNQPENDRPEFGDITAQPKSEESDTIPNYIRKISSSAVDTLVKPFSDVLEDIFSGPPAVIDAANSTMQKSKLSQQQPTSSVATSSDPPHASDVIFGIEDDNGDSDSQSQHPSDGREVFTTVAEPLCNLMIELFELKERSSYLRRQAVLLILQQVLGGTIERKVVENVNWLVKEEQMVGYFERLLDSIWPHGELGTSWPQRTREQRETAKRQAKGKLLNIVAEVFSGMVGGDNARRGALRLFDAFQSVKLNKHLIFTIFDEIIGALFPELARIGTTNRGGEVMTAEQQQQQQQQQQHQQQQHSSSSSSLQPSSHKGEKRDSKAFLNMISSKETLDVFVAVSEAFQQQAGPMFG